MASCIRVNFVRPLSVVQEIWRASDPSLPLWESAPFDSVRRSRLAFIWWGAFVGRAVVAWPMIVQSGDAKTIAALRAMTYEGMISNALGIVAAVCCAAVIVAISRRQALITSTMPARTVPLGASPTAVSSSIPPAAPG